ncbi:MAG: hypothetical protein IPM07_14385 [Anaerolineales bacterium]|nr:hypothetical protein [Anaerolineales bacterium]
MKEPTEAVSRTTGMASARRRRHGGEETASNEFTRPGERSAMRYDRRWWEDAGRRRRPRTRRCTVHPARRRCEDKILKHGYEIIKVLEERSAG